MAIASATSPSSPETSAAPSSSQTRGLANWAASSRQGGLAFSRGISFGPSSANAGAPPRSSAQRRRSHPSRHTLGQERRGTQHFQPQNAPGRSELHCGLESSPNGPRPRRRPSAGCERSPPGRSHDGLIRSATLPRSRRRSPVFPRVPMTIRSAFISLAKSRIIQSMLLTRQKLLGTRSNRSPRRRGGDTEMIAEPTASSRPAG